jgi:hypothetical protein
MSKLRVVEVTTEEVKAIVFGALDAPEVMHSDGKLYVDADALREWRASQEPKK